MESHFRQRAVVGGPALSPSPSTARTTRRYSFGVFRDNTLPVDVRVHLLAPERGYCRPVVRLRRTGGQIAKTVIAEVNPNMPRTYGESFVHVSEIGFLCREPLPESKPPRIVYTVHQIYR
ncbi:MAG: hypothetical protein ACLVB4_07935 [Butyricicoccus sp.]